MFTALLVAALVSAFVGNGAYQWERFPNYVFSSYPDGNRGLNRDGKCYVFHYP